MLTHQVVVRVTPSLREALECDARDRGRTVAQSVRFLLRDALKIGVGVGTTPTPGKRAK